MIVRHPFGIVVTSSQISSDHALFGQTEKGIVISLSF